MRQRIPFNYTINDAIKLLEEETAQLKTLNETDECIRFISLNIGTGKTSVRGRGFGINDFKDNYHFMENDEKIKFLREQIQSIKNELEKVNKSMDKTDAPR